jgi:hypothetical protein
MPPRRPLYAVADEGSVRRQLEPKIACRLSKAGPADGSVILVELAALVADGVGADCPNGESKQRQMAGNCG